MRPLLNSMVNMSILSRAPTSSFSDGQSFLSMVEKYFDKAGKHTNIPEDRLNFLKKPECVVKFNLTLNRGTF